MIHLEVNNECKQTGKSVIIVAADVLRYIRTVQYIHCNYDSCVLLYNEALSCYAFNVSMFAVNFLETF